MIYGEPGTNERREGIGGSDAAAVLGVSPWLSRLGLWELKRGLREGDPPTERMQWGTRLEPAIIMAYEERTGYRVARYNDRPQVHPNYPFMRGTPDGITPDRLIEVKAIGRLSDEWGEEGTADIPAHYYAQVQHYMALEDEELCDVVVLVGGQELKVWTVPADEPFQLALVEQERDFWESVKTGVPPEPDGSEDARRALQTLYPRAERDEIEATPEITAAAQLYIVERSIRTEAEKAQEVHAQKLMAYIGDHTDLVGEGFRASWANVAGSTSWLLVAQGYRTVIEEQADHYPLAKLDALVELHTSPPSRRLTVKGDKA